MGASDWVQLGAGFFSGGAATWLFKSMLRGVRGDVDREDRLAGAESTREAAELTRLLDEIALIRLDRRDKEALVDLLRRQLDHALVRNNASTTIARMLLAAVDAEEKPSRQMIAARAQARHHINATDEQLQRGNWQDAP